MNNVLTVEQLFSDRFLQIPDYQRGYAWDKPQLDELLEDLELLPAGKQHYTGTVVLHAAAGGGVLDEEGKSYLIFNVVDGQQRLTTLVLLMDAIRRELLADGFTKLADGIKKTYISVPSPSGQPLYKLTLNADCHGFFVDNALADSPGPQGAAIFSQQRLAYAKEHFKSYLAKKRRDLGGEFQLWLPELRAKATQHLRLLMYVVADESEVGVVFETMNNRGTHLTELEKVKNYLLYLTTKMDVAADAVRTIRGVINQTWADVFKGLMTAGLAAEEDRLLRMHWVIAYNPRRKDWHDSKTIKARFNLRAYHGKHKDLLRDLTEYAQGLRFASAAFCDVLSPKRTEAFSAFKLTGRRAEMANASEKLQRLSVVAPFLPLLMAARLRFTEDPEVYIELARLCELFGFRVYRFLLKRSHTGQSALWSLGHRLYRDAVPVAEVSTSLRRLILRYCSDELFNASFTRNEGENWYEWSGIKYFLYEYEQHLASAAKTPVQVLWSMVQDIPLKDSIEHILPQTATDPYWVARFKAADRKLYTHDFGNLCLTLHNSSYGKKSFTNKKGSPGAKEPCYANAGFFMERALAGVDDWTVEKLVVRKQAIASWALTRWHVDPVDDDETTQVQDDDDDDDE